MTRLYSYTVHTDDGAAPNPFHGMCTLAICKPRIRSTAQIGDWIAGLGSKNAPTGDLSGKLVYAMRVQDVIPLADYDSRAKAEWPHRLPDVTSRDLADRLGDCIYDYSAGAPPRQRPGVHGKANIQTDLSGKSVLISRDFYYFGSAAEPLPNNLMPICHQTQGHKSTANAPYVGTFEKWIRNFGNPGGQIYGWPGHVIDWSAERISCGCIPRAEDEDEEGC